MKIITNLNWIILISGILLLSYVALNKKAFGYDPAGEGLAEVYAVFGLIYLGLLLLINFLPFPWIRITIFVLLCLPLVASLPHLFSRLVDRLKAPAIEQGQHDGTYYFTDAPRRELAQATSSRDLATVKTLLQTPVPQLKESGRDHVTLLDFAAMVAINHPDDSPDVFPYLALLLNKGATIQNEDSLHIPTHILVCRNGPTRLLAWLLKKGADPNAPDPQNENAPVLFSVMTSATDNRTEKVRLLLANGATVESLYPTQAHSWLAGHTALQAAARQEFWDVCQLLLEQGADPFRTGPQHFAFTKFVAHQATLFAQLSTTPPESFVAMQQALAPILARKSS